MIIPWHLFTNCVTIAELRRSIFGRRNSSARTAPRSCSTHWSTSTRSSSCWRWITDYNLNLWYSLEGFLKFLSWVSYIWTFSFLPVRPWTRTKSCRSRTSWSTGRSRPLRRRPPTRASRSCWGITRPAPGNLRAEEVSEWGLRRSLVQSILFSHDEYQINVKMYLIM